MNRKDAASQTGLEHALSTILFVGHEASAGADNFASYSGDDNDTSVFPDDVRNKVAAAWVPFFDRAWALVDNTSTIWSDNPGRIGYDWVLTGGRHGAGFWDRGEGVTGDILTELTRELPPPDGVSFPLYTEDGREVWFES